MTTLSNPGKARAKKLRELNKCVVEFQFALRTVQSFFCRAENESSTGRALVPGDFAESSRWIQETDSERIAMETLYDLLGALPNDDTDELRAAFRRAAKRVHPDINSEDPDAGLKFHRIVRANEILGDAEQRAAYDHLLALEHQEQEQAAKQAAADKVRKVASGVMVLAGISVVAVGYALFVQLSANALTPATATTEAVRVPAAIVATGPAEDGAESVSAAPLETSGRAEITTSAIVPAAVTAPGREGRPLGHTPKHAPRDRKSVV